MKRALLILILNLPVMPAMCDWAVDPEGSYVGFATVKNDLIAENHSFTQVTGSVSDAGVAIINVALASVETLIPIRNERMQSMLFDVAQHPIATVTSQINTKEFTSLTVGESKTMTLDMQVDLHAIVLKKAVLVKVTRSSQTTFEVSSLGPIVIHASQFALSDGVESLRKIAGLQSIGLMVPVTFDLSLVRSSPSP